MTAQLTPERQLQDWLAGTSRCPNTSNECCPDFSCCRPSLLQPLDVRQRFMAATDRQRHAMLMDFLMKFVADVDPKARVIG